jgi:hypothetical protein
MKIQGKLEHSALEGGVWVLRGSDGNTYQLSGISDDLLQEGARVEVEGKVDEGAFSIGMMGNTLQVTSARKL